jgi:TatD DNase family protein
VTLALTDTHCHLDFEAFDLDREQVIQRARAAGLSHILNPGIDLDTSRQALRLAEQYAEVYVAVGVHPNSATCWDDTTYAALRSLAEHPRVVAIGEIGLDYYRDHAPRDLQRSVLRRQLVLAGETGLPVILHNRDASDDLLDILAEWRSELETNNSPLATNPGVLHSFSGSLETARQALDLGFQIGITGPVTFKNAAGLQDVVKSIPTGRLLVETDAPFLTPHPLRGKRNEPAYVALTAEKIAVLHGLAAEELARITTANAGRLFHWRESF